MFIIKIEPLENGLHLIESQSHRKECWLEDYIAIPPELIEKAVATDGYCDLAIEDGVLVDVIATEKPVEPVVDPEPTELEQMRADIDYIAMETGVEL